MQLRLLTCLSILPTLKHVHWIELTHNLNSWHTTLVNVMWWLNSLNTSGKILRFTRLVLHSCKALQPILDARSKEVTLQAGCRNNHNVITMSVPPLTQVREQENELLGYWDSHRKSTFQWYCAYFEVVHTQNPRNLFDRLSKHTWRLESDVYCKS